MSDNGDLHNLNNFWGRPNLIIRPPALDHSIEGSQHFMTDVVYFDQQTGALHAVGWSKSFVFVFKQVFCIFPSHSGEIEK